MLQEQLEEFGLSEKEAKIYLALLKEKSATAAHLAKIAKLNRTTAYFELERLMQHGLVNYVIKNTKRYYQPASPTKLIQLLEYKKEKVKAILPQLNSLHATQEPFRIEIYEGKEGIKTFYQDILNSKTNEFYAFGVTGKATNILEFEYPHFINKFAKAEIKEYALANHDAKKIMDKHPKKFLKIKYLPEQYKADVTTIIYANKLAIQSLNKGSIYVSVIKDPALYRSYKNYFDFMWNALK